MQSAKLKIIQSQLSVAVLHCGMLSSSILARCTWGETGDFATREVARKAAITEAYRLSLKGFGEVHRDPRTARFSDHYAELDVLWEDFQARRQQLKGAAV